MVTKTQLRDPAVFHAISDPTRRAILDALRGRELAAGELARRFPVSRPAIARHVGVLSRAGLVRHRQVAQSRIYALEPAALAEVAAWLEPYRLYWAARLSDLKSVVEADLAAEGEDSHD
ncbi:DNA-binding transcriptional ArsR family regulator [Caulobacter ginsengisoli]|uniref:DNA-binding transcriptional ArsR family regulator n=1 Tax=Caulobacter ginsengisoli TaxID=400775 RepID=A0ABU0IZP6_9CAUL|nr:metalloregulator ArsR/SmtB family transcription factor [Caulobacter ginsengisoli]MDQ0466771.1 DNA-binding transcriptional ArsR family regulator [Caulobacter ginsengisoli]